MEKHRYPAEWKKIAFDVKEKAGWQCQNTDCGLQCRKPGEPFDTHKRTLTVHHKNHIPEDCRPENLIALCSSCHLKADAKFHAEHRKQRKKLEA